MHASVVTVRSHLPSIFVLSVPQSIFILFFISSSKSLFHSVIPTAVASFCCIYRRRCYGVVAAQATSESCSTPWDCTNSDESELFKTLFTRRVVQNIINTPIRQLFKKKASRPSLVQYCLRLLSIEKKKSFQVYHRQSPTTPAKPSRCAPNTSTSTIAAVPTLKEMSSTAPNEAHLALGCASKSADERATTAPNTAASHRDSLQVSGYRIFLEGAAPTT